MSNKITIFGAHHTGGLGRDPYASTKHLDFDHIQRAHYRNWPDFPSEYFPTHIGYNVLVFPDGSWRQTRLIGEETAAVKGHNKEGFYPCLIGNFNERPDGHMVDHPTAAQMITLKDMEIALIEGKAEEFGLKVKPGTIIDIKLHKIGPHRFWQPTQCYGTGLLDRWARDFAVEYFKEKINLLTRILILYQKLLGVYQSLKRFGSFKAGSAPVSCLDEDTRG